MIKIDDLSNSDYSVYYVESQHKVMLKGIMNIRSTAEYSGIRDYIYNMFLTYNLPLIIDVIHLESLNSSGIAMLGLLMVKTKEIEKSIYLHADEHSFWQYNSLRDLEGINPNLKVEFFVRH